MTSVMAGEQQVRAALAGLEDRVAIAAINSPENVVISGFEAEVAAAEARLLAQGVTVRRLRVSHAFHSPQMRGIEAAFESAAAEISYHAPRIPLISSVTGRPVGPEEMSDPAYWRCQVSQPVRFRDAMETLRKQGQGVFLEIGPGSALLTLGRQCIGQEQQLWTPSLRRGSGEWSQILNSLGRLYLRGAQVDWNGFDQPYRRQRVAIPSYPFQRQRYWIRNKPSERSSGPHAEVSHTEPEMERYQSLRPELDALCSGYVVNALRAAGWDFPPGETITTAGLEKRCEVAPRQRKLFLRLLEILAEDGVLTKGNDSWTVQRTPQGAASPASLDQLLERYPDFGPQLRMTGRCGQSLGAVLQEKMSPLDLLFPDGSSAEAEKIYTDSPVARRVNHLVSELVATEVSQRSGKTVRILEVGAGTGGTTAAVVPVLPPGRTEYLYTDLSPFFEAHAAARFEKYPFLRYQTLDIEKDPEAQGFGRGQFDIVVAANVLHATANLRRTIQNVRSLLAPGGCLVLMEGTAKDRWVDLTFGLTDGWWRFTDYDIRPSHPLLSPPAWRALLREAGFMDGGAGQLPENAPQAVFLARLPGPRSHSATPAVAGRVLSKSSLPVLPNIEDLRQASPAVLRTTLLDFLSGSVASILRIDKTKLDVTRPVTEFGLDSLMALEVRNRLNLGLGITIPTVRFLDGASIEDLAALTSALLRETPDKPAEVTLESEVDYPLSHGQQAQWFGYKCMPDSSTFNVGFTAKATPSLNWPAFERAVGKLTERHAALRTILVAQGEGYPLQRVLPSVTPAVVLTDARGWSEADLKEKVIQDFRRIFDLDRPMFRITVFRCESGDVILFNVHHLMIDARSLQLCLEDLKVLYSAEVQGLESPLEPLTAGYRDFVEAEARMLAGPEAERLWDYWHGRLGGELPLLQLPTSRKRPDVVRPRGESIPLAFDPLLLTEVRRAARECRVTEYVFLLACYQILLHLYTGQNDIVVGTSASSRDNPRWANLVGYFVNLLPMRGDLSGNPTFRNHLERTRDAVLGALEHQEFPFSVIVSRLRLRRSPDRSPVFQTFFNFLTDRVGELGALFLGVEDCAVQFGDSSLRAWMVIPQQEGQSEIVLQLSEVGGRLGGNLNYNSDVVDRETAEAMAADFQKVLEAAVRQPDTPGFLLLPETARATAGREEIVL